MPQEDNKCTITHLDIYVLGEHETSNWPCHLALQSSCHRPCGRLLECGNHTCTIPCHVVESAPDKIKAGSNCEQCNNYCTKSRPEGCQHPCPKPCHLGPCLPCKAMIRIKCHCQLNQPYVCCSEWIDVNKREELQSCGNQCPKNFECGHRCKSNCHSGPCPNADLCKKKIKVTCKCKRIKKEFSCETVRKNLALVECDAVCFVRKEEEKRMKDAMNEQKKQEEEQKNKKELEKYQKMFEGKKKNRVRRTNEEHEEASLVKRYWYVVAFSLVIILSIAIHYIVNLK
ncbi:hypothetical protein NQ318_005055 [Aromia moschata]|uniref:NF-X1-type domain-containing protein n=1 Tax=Aromia moschata TaxID=1265417 RepID=A0AAV8YED6_9CUCU|nr:hypothetical protein NQ318_005055 [Aromia moschata]